MKRLLHLILISLAGVSALRGVDWQWSAPVQPPAAGTSSETPRAFLWIPADCTRVRGLVFGHHNMEE